MTGTLETGFTRLFGLHYPIVQGPMGGVSGPGLVAAVANAGGLGVLPIWVFEEPEHAAYVVRETQSLTDRPFAVNLRADLVQLDHIHAALDAGVSIIHLFWGDPAPSMAPVRAGGARMIATVGDAGAARAAVDAGASALIAQGVEAGGHVLGETPLRDLLPSVIEVAGDVPVIAAGGLADADDVARVIAQGAAGALLGTRFAASEESDAHDEYKRLLMGAPEGATVRSLCFDLEWPDAPHRTLRNSTFAAWERAGFPAPGARPGEGDVVLRMPDGMELPRYSAYPPGRGMSGELEAAALYAGTGVDKVREVLPAGEIVRMLSSRLAA